MPTTWLIITFTAVALFGAGAFFVLNRHWQQARAMRVAHLKAEHARLAAAVSELLNRVNDIDLASKYQQSPNSLSTRLGDTCTEVGQLADAVQSIEKLLESSDLKETTKLFQQTLALALRLSKEINNLRAEMR